MSKRKDILEHLQSLKVKSESAFAEAVELKDPRLISEAMGRINQIDSDILKEEHRRKEAQIVRENPVNWDSPENRAIEATHEYLIAQFECLTDKSIKGELFA